MVWSPMNLALWSFEYIAKANEHGRLPPYNNSDYDKFVEVGLLERVKTDEGWCCKLTDEGWRAYRDSEVMLMEYEPRLRALIEWRPKD